MTSLISDVVVPGVAAGAGYALVATGFNVVERTTRIFNFGHGDLIALGPMVTLVLLRKAGVSDPVALAGGIVATLITAIVIERIAIRPYINRQGSYLWLIATLGVSAMLEGAYAEPFQSQPVGFPIGVSGKPVDFLYPLNLTQQQLLLIAVTIVVGLVLAAFYRFTRTGLMLVAAGEDPMAPRPSEYRPAACPGLRW